MKLRIRFQANDNFHVKVVDPYPIREEIPEAPPAAETAMESPAPEPVAEPNRHLVTQEEIANLGVFALAPPAAIAWALVLWRLGQDMGLAGGFVISTGALSHWQPWFAVAMTLQGAIFFLNRRSRGDDDESAA